MKTPKNIYKNVFGVIFFSLCYFFYQCEKEETIEYDETLVFKNTYEIAVPSYSYTINDSNYTIGGDDSYFNNQIADTVPKTPMMAWEPNEMSIICVAIFSSPIIVQKNKIVNADSIVWIWHTGLFQNTDRQLEFEEGKSISSGNIETLSDANELISGRIYYWAIWGWNSEAVRVKYSSRPQKIFIE